jgi:hypothetical protein
MKLVKRNNKLRTTFQNDSPEYASETTNCLGILPPRALGETVELTNQIVNLPNRYPPARTNVLRKQGTDGIQWPLGMAITYDLQIVMATKPASTIVYTTLATFNGSFTAPVNVGYDGGNAPYYFTFSGGEEFYSAYGYSIPPLVQACRIGTGQWIGSSTDITLPYNSGDVDPYDYTTGTFTGIPAVTIAVTYFPNELTTGYYNATNTPTVNADFSFLCVDGPVPESYDPQVPDTEAVPTFNFGLADSAIDGYSPCSFTLPIPAGITELPDDFPYFQTYLAGTINCSPICNACDCNPVSPPVGLLDANPPPNWGVIWPIGINDLYQPTQNLVTVDDTTISSLAEYASTYAPVVNPGAACSETTAVPACIDFCIQLGTSGTFTSAGAGILYMLFSDTLDAYADNTGSFTVVFDGTTYTVEGNNAAGVSVTIAAGTSYSYSATGSINNGTGNIFGPNGLASHNAVVDWTPCPTANYGSLIGVFQCAGDLPVTPPSINCLYNTGQEVLLGGFTSGGGSPCDMDTGWTYNGAPAAAPSSPFAGYPIANGVNYRWISKECDGLNLDTALGNVFATTFTIPTGTTLTTYNVTGKSSADNWVDSIVINGVGIDIGNFSTATISGTPILGTTTGYTSVQAWATATGNSVNIYEFNTLNQFFLPITANWIIGINSVAFVIGEDADTLGGLLVQWSYPCTPSSAP